MKRALTGLSVTVFLVIAPASVSLGAELGIITGGEKGTSHQFGLNLQQLVKQSGISLSVYPSKGSVDNLYAVYQRPRIQLGIVQSDVLAFIGAVQSNPALKRIAQKTRVVFPLYDEEVHVLARGDVKDFDGLTGRRVAIGREGSGTYLTARLLFSVSGVAPAEVVPIDIGEAVAELKAGRLDAAIYVAGYPVKLLNEGVSQADALTLIPITDKSIAEFYSRTEIPADSYHWHTRPVQTVAVKAVLVSSDSKQNCDTVGRFARTVADNMDWLTKNGHPKWKAVDLDFPLEGWEQDDCVRKHLGKPVGAPMTAKSSGNNPVTNALREILGD